MIDKIFIIVSKEFEKDRFEYLNNYFENNKTNIPIEYFEPYYKNRDEDKININKYRNLKKGEIMLSETYIKLFTHIVENNLKYTLILESDVLFENNFFENLQIIFDEWINVGKHPSIVFLGTGANLQPNIKNKISENLFLQNSTKCTDSMLFDLDAIKHILNKKNNLLLINKPIDHLWNYFIGKDIFSYWIKNPLVIQGSQTGVYKSTIS
jgi:GR25 family glycosyltransferase involved in LPS biosynthesis